MLKSPTSRWSAGAAGVCTVLLALTWFALVGPKRAEAADLTQQAASARQANDAMQIRTAQLKTQFASLPQRQAELTTLVGQMPPVADVPRFVRSLNALAESAGVRVDGVTPAPGESLDAKPGGAGTSASAPAASSGSATSLEVVAVPMTITVHGPYFKTVTFLKGLQTGQRAFLVTGVQVTVDETGVSLAIRGRVFAVPGAADALTGTASATSTGTAPATGAARATGGTAPATAGTVRTLPGPGAVPAATPGATPGATPAVTPAPTPSPSR